MIADYVKSGGRLLVMVDPGSKAGLEGLLARWGLKVDTRVVLDEQKILNGELTMPVVSSATSSGVYNAPKRCRS